VAHCVVPAVVGKPLGKATDAIEKAKCKVGDVKKAYSRRKKGTVIAQAPRAHAKLRVNAKVNLTVSRGRKPQRHTHPRSR